MGPKNDRNGPANSTDGISKHVICIHIVANSPDLMIMLSFTGL